MHNGRTHGGDKIQEVEPGAFRRILVLNVTYQSGGEKATSIFSPFRLAGMKGHILPLVVVSSYMGRRRINVLVGAIRPVLFCKTRRASRSVSVAKPVGSSARSMLKSMWMKSSWWNSLRASPAVACEGAGRLGKSLENHFGADDGGPRTACPVLAVAEGADSQPVPDQGPLILTGRSGICWQARC